MNWHIYLQTVLGLVAVTQKHKFFGTALTVYRFNLLLVNIKSWYATVNTSLLFPQVTACGFIFYRCITEPQHVCCSFNIFIKYPLPLSFECYKLLSWFAQGQWEFSWHCNISFIAWNTQKHFITFNSHIRQPSKILKTHFYHQSMGHFSSHK